MISQSFEGEALALPAMGPAQSRWASGAVRLRARIGLWSRNVRGVSERLAALWGEWRRRAQGRHQLARLDGRMLKDIGISRSDVLQEHAKWFWRS